MNKKIRFVLIGCGSISAKHVIAINRIKNAEVVGAYDVNASSAKAFSETHMIPVFTDLEDMIERTDPHFLNILTPSGLHAKNIFELMRFNRNFVVEKPLALRLDDVDTTLEECDKRGLKIFVVQQNRFNPPVQKLKEALDKGRFGKIVMGTVRLRWRRTQSYYEKNKWKGAFSLGGGVLSNQASHHIDMLRWMMGPINSVLATTATRLLDIEVEDTGAAILKFKSGAIGIIEATCGARPKDLEGSLSLLGEKGAVEIGGFFMNELKTWNFSEPNKMDNEIWTSFANVPDEPAWNHTEFFKNVIDSFICGKVGLIDGVEGRKTVELINAIYESADTGKEIFLRFTPEKSRLGKGVE